MENRVYFETIRVESGFIYNLSWHTKRVERTTSKELSLEFEKRVLEFGFKRVEENGLKKCARGLNIYKLKVLYSDKKVESCEILEYKRREVLSLKIIESNIIYDKKYNNREDIEKLFSKRDGACDLLIVHNRYIKDSSICNIAILKDDNIWHTPKAPLLKGTTRDRLLYYGELIESDIDIDDLKNAKSIALMNSMIGFYKYPYKIRF